MPSYRVECRTCGWVNESRDRASCYHSATVHSEMLHPGHFVVIVR